MTGKEYLSRAKRLDDNINCLLREAEYWRQLSCGITGAGLGENHNPNRPTEASFVKCIEKIDAVERDIKARIDELVSLKHAIHQAVEAMDNVEEQIVLRSRYLNNLSWEDISRMINVSLRTVHRIHSSALKNFPVPK